MEKLHLDLDINSYDILFNNDFSGLVGAMKDIEASGKILIVTDSNVNDIYGKEVYDLLNSNGYDVAVYAFEAGEEHKNMATILDICNECINHQLDRKSMIIALGGGVVGDMAGFAASIYMRGIDFIQIPTTLLSQSDSSVGGKTGVDFKNSKNILGAFHQPKLVYINVSTLKTLPECEFISGMGEVIKHGIIRDNSFFEFLKNNVELVKSLDSDTLIKMAKINCSIKAEVVMKDEKENGLRAILNFGHTIGHAVESAFDFSMTHGECVGIGMCSASYIAKERGLISNDMLNDIVAVLLSYNFRTKLELPKFEVIYDFMQKDKKKIDGKLKFVLPICIGDVDFVTDVTKDEIMSAIEYIRV